MIQNFLPGRGGATGIELRKRENSRENVDFCKQVIDVPPPTFFLSDV